MKKLFFLFVCAAIAAACSSEMEVPSPVNPDDDMVEVSFNLAGDYVSVEETPLTRAFHKDAKTLYVIQICNKRWYQLGLRPDNGCYLYPGVAYGLFTDPEKIRLKIHKGKYEFRVLVVKEREDVFPNMNGVYSFSGGLYDTDKYLLENHYKHSVTHTSTITNSFVASDTTLDLQDYNFTLKKFDRYYVAQEIDVKDEGPISINLVRRSFGITYNITRPLDGEISICLDDFSLNNDFYYEPKQVVYDIGKYEMVGAEEANLKIKWIRGNEGLKGYEEVRKLRIEKNKNYNLNVNMNDRVDENHFEFHYGKAEFSNEDINIQ